MVGMAVEVVQLQQAPEKITQMFQILYIIRLHQQDVLADLVQGGKRTDDQGMV